MSDEVNPKTSPFSVLPEGCIANIISLTSPKDACRVAAVAQGFKSAADSDTVWERFLPPNYGEIVSRASFPLAFSTKKQLYFFLRDSTLLLDGGKLSFSLTKSSENWYLLSSRALQIAAIDNPEHWEWTCLPESSFAEVAKLRSINRLEISGIMPARMLSPNTRYVAWLKCMLTVVDDGLDVPSKASIKFVKEDGTETEVVTNTVYLVKQRNRRYDGTLADHWYGIELGEFFIGEGGRFDIRIEVSETQYLNQKKGLVIEGIELRPNNWWNFEEVVIKGIEQRPNNWWNFEELLPGEDETNSEEVSGEDEADSEEVWSGEDETNSEEVSSGEDEADSEEVWSGEDETNSEEVSSGKDGANSEEVSSEEDETNSGELSSREDEATIEEEHEASFDVSLGEDEANIEEEHGASFEVSSGEDGANIEEEHEASFEVSSGEDEANIEEVFPAEDEVNIEEEDGANIEEEFMGEDEVNIEEEFLGEDGANFEVSWGEDEANFEVSWGQDEANFEVSWGEDVTYYEEASWGEDDGIFYL